MRPSAWVYLMVLITRFEKALCNSFSLPLNISGLVLLLQSIFNICCFSCARTSVCAFTTLSNCSTFFSDCNVDVHYYGRLIEMIIFLTIILLLINFIYSLVSYLSIIEFLTDTELDTIWKIYEIFYT